MKTADKWMIAALVALALAGGVQAAEDGWSYKITPYLWALGVDGDIGVGPLTAPVDIDFTDAVEDLEFGAMLSGEANYGPWSVLGDVAYLDLKTDEDTQVGEFEVKLEQWLVQGAVAYRVVQNDATTLDLGMGCRYFSLETRLRTPAETADRKASEGWADPIFVARVRQQITENFYGVLAGDIGGFGVSSDLTWSVNALAGYAFTDWLALLGGYRYLDYDYEDGPFSFDAAESGLVIGLQFLL